MMKSTSESTVREEFNRWADSGRGEEMEEHHYYRDNPHCHQWGALLSMPTHLLSAHEWEALFRDAGFTSVVHQRIPDNSPTPEVYTGRWFKDAEQMKKFKQEGALLIRGAKPA